MAIENDNRKSFLLEWYKILWSNAQKSMDSIWKLLGPLTLVGTVWIAIYKNYIPFSLGNSLVFIILFWAINITIDFNQWHRRNLIFYTAVEKEFFSKEDYGKLIPMKFEIPKSKWISFYMICVIVFCALLIFSVVFALENRVEQGDSCPYHWIIFGLGLIFSIKYFWNQEKSSKNYIKELFKK